MSEKEIAELEIYYREALALANERIELKSKVQLLEEELSKKPKYVTDEQILEIFKITEGTVCNHREIEAAKKIRDLIWS